MAVSKSRIGPLNNELDSASPFLVEFFTVQALGSQCMAYRSQDGKWRRAFDHLELPGYIRVLE
ncbi:MAG TPA: hypothetical protein VGN23_08540 [Verrucomicrobiae bacterium]